MILRKSGLNAGYIKQKHSKIIYAIWGRIKMTNKLLIITALLVFLLALLSITSCVKWAYIAIKANQIDNKKRK